METKDIVKKEEKNLKKKLLISETIQKNDNKAITLVALVITIVILLILAGISVSMVIGENSVVQKALESREVTKEAQKEEEETFLDMQDMIEDYGESEEEKTNGDIYTIADGVLNIKDEYLVTGKGESVTRTGSSQTFDDGLYLKDGIGTTLYIPQEVNGEKVTSIAQSAFEGILNLRRVVIADGIETIGMNAFHNCNGLKSVTMPDSVTNIGMYAFLRMFEFKRS